MSVLTYLIFTSLVYCTLADPVPVDKPEGSTPPPAELSDDEFQSRVEALVTEIREAVKEHLSFILDQLPPDERDDVENTAFDGIVGYLNYVIYMCKDDSDSKTASELDDSTFFEFFSPPGIYIPGSADKAEAAGNN